MYKVINQNIIKFLYRIFNHINLFIRFGDLNNADEECA